MDELNSSNILEGRNITLVSINIVDMFTNIPKDIGIQQCTKHLDDRPDQEKLFSTSCVNKALEITLDYNIETFNGQTFRQMKGAEPINLSNTRPYFWARLRDDILMIWTGSIDQLTQFI